MSKQYLYLNLNTIVFDALTCSCKLVVFTALKVFFEPKDNKGQYQI